MENWIALFWQEYSLYWHGIILAVALLIVVITACTLRKLQGERVSDMLVLALFALPLAFAGSKLYYCWHGQELYTDRMELMTDLSVGGNALYGALAGALIAVLLVCLLLHLNVGRVLDCAAPAVALGIAVGRWGSLFSNEDRGDEVTAEWLQQFPLASFDAQQEEWVLNVFVLESLAALVTFCVLIAFWRGRYISRTNYLKNGDICLIFMFMLGLSQAFLEYLRADALYWAPIYVTKLRFILITQAMSTVIATIGMAVLLIRHVYQKGFRFTTVFPILCCPVFFCLIFNMELRLNTDTVWVNYAAMLQSSLMLTVIGLWTAWQVSRKENASMATVLWLGPRKRSRR